jgi:F0F1-type ATP synthase membrane subunit b/b'
MVNVYECKYCDFQTHSKTNFNIHANSIKHQDKVRERVVKCEYCSNEIDKLEISAHCLTCINKILVDKLVTIKLDDAIKVHKISLEAECLIKLDKLRDMHCAEIKKLTKKNDNSLAYQNRERRKEFDSLKKLHKIELDCAKTDSDKMKQEYQKEIDNMKVDADKIKQQYQKEIDSIRTDNDKIKQQHQKEIESIKQEYKEYIDYYKNEFTTVNAKLHDVKDKQLETTFQCKEKEIARMETVLKTCGKITEKSVDGICSALTFANTEFTKAPVLTKMCKFDFVDDYECVDDLLRHHAENTIYKYVGDIIIILYKKEKAGDQSFWNTDSSRLGYIIRQKVDAKILWGKDVNADRITNFVIIPLVEFFIECVDDRKKAESKFIKKNSDCPKHSKMYDKIIRKEALCKNLIFVKSALLDAKLSKNIIKYITPKFNISAQMSLGKK